ncbi:MAG: hypothetical protein AB1585_00560 [Thermodesulfobacteriota bacterium]
MDAIGMKCRKTNWNLRKSWNRNESVTDKLSAIGDWLRAFGDWEQLEDYLSTPQTTNPKSSRWAVHEKQEEYGIGCYNMALIPEIESNKFTLFLS